jgi:hypothetical protein
MEPKFISEKCKFWVKNTVMYCLQKPVTKMRSSPVIAFLNLVYFLSKKDPVEHTFFTNLKIVDEAGYDTRISAAKPSFARFIGFLFHLAVV